MPTSKTTKPAAPTELIKFKVTAADFKLLQKVAKTRKMTWDENLANMVWCYLLPVKGK